MRRFLWDRDSQRGQAILLVAITLMGMLMAVGLAVDAGQLYASRRTMQEAADAGAYAGAVVLYQQGTQADARAAAAADTTRNGFTDNVDGFDVFVNAPPTSGPYNGNNLYVEVIIEGWVRTAIVPAQSVLNFIRVRAVAGSEPLNNEYAIMSLNRGSTNCAFNAESQAEIHLTGGGILVNSSSNNAACNDLTNALDFTISSPHGIDINGNASGSVWPIGMDVDTGEPQQADPFAGWPKPSTSNCSPLDPITPSTPCTVYSGLPGGSTKVLNPGIYNIQIGGGGGTLFILNPGIYILKDGLDLAGNADLYSAGQDSPPTCTTYCGVFFFSTHTNYPSAFRPGIDTCGQTNLQGSAFVKVAAMTTHPEPTFPYLNFLFYQDPACSDPNWNMKIGGSGGAQFNGSGTIYIPTNEFELNGTNTTLTGSQMIANTVDLQTGNITIDFVSGNTAQPILPRLAE